MNAMHLRTSRLCSCFDAISATRGVRQRVSSAWFAVTYKAGHNARQAEIFDAKVASFQQPLPADIQDRLQRIASSVPVGTGYRVIDVGSGTGCLIPHLQAAGWSDILAVDLSPNMLEGLRQNFAPPSTVGNDGGVRTWLGDIAELPLHQGRASAVYMNAVFGNVSDQKAALLRAVTLLLPEGHIVLSHPLGRTWHEELRSTQPDMCPHSLPDETALNELILDLPLEVVSFVDEPDFYCATLKIPARFEFPGAPIRLKGLVVNGFQRGSKQMGIPTANIEPGPLEAQLRAMQRGVYFGWAKLMQPSRDGDGDVVKMVMNVGIRPTIQDGSNMTVEVHLLHDYAEDFYGKEVRVLASGFLRPEMRLASLDALIVRIRTDISAASAQLDCEECQALSRDEFFA